MRRYDKVMKIKMEILVVLVSALFVIAGCNAPVLIYDVVEGQKRESKINKIQKRNDSFLVITNKDPKFIDLESTLFNISSKNGYIKSITSKEELDKIAVPQGTPKPLHEIYQLKELSEKYKTEYIYLNLEEGKKNDNDVEKIKIYSVASGQTAIFEGGEFTYFSKWMDETFPSVGQGGQEIESSNIKDIAILEVNGSSSSILEQAKRTKLLYLETSEVEPVSGEKTNYLLCKRTRSIFDLPRKEKPTGKLLWGNTNINKHGSYTEIINFLDKQPADTVVVLYLIKEKRKLTSFEKKAKEANTTIKVKGFVYSKEKKAIIGTVLSQFNSDSQLIGYFLKDFTEYLIQELQNGETTIFYSPLFG